MLWKNPNKDPFAARIPMSLFASSKSRRKVKHEVSEEQKLEIKESFDLFDVNKDGALDRNELKVPHS